MVYHKDTKKQARNMKFTSLFFTASADHFRDLPQKQGLFATQQKERPLHHIRAEGVYGQHHVEVSAAYLDIDHALLGNEVASLTGQLQCVVSTVEVLYMISFSGSKGRPLTVTFSKVMSSTLRWASQWVMSQLSDSPKSGQRINDIYMAYLRHLLDIGSFRQTELFDTVSFICRPLSAKLYFSCTICQLFK